MPPPRISIYCEWPGGNTYSTLQFQFPKEPPFVTVVLPYENQYVPWNASKIKLGSIEVHAGLNDAFIDSITVTHTGFSSQISDISHILISQSGTIVSEKWVFDPILLSSVIRLKNPIRIKAGSSEKFDFLVTLTNSVKPQAWHNFMITWVNNSSNGAQGIPTLIGGWITTTTFKVSTLNISIINTPLSVSSGQLNTRIATIRVASGSTRNITLQNFTLTKVGGVDYTNAFAQVWVYKNGAKVGTVRVTTNTIQVTGINALIVPGEISEFEVRADIIHTGPTSNTSFMINDSLDVSATETDTGYDTPVSFPGWSQWITLVWR